MQDQKCGALLQLGARQTLDRAASERTSGDPNFTKINVAFGGTGSWNDIVSSVQTDGATVQLFEAINFAGDSLIDSSFRYRGLETVGWNDRVSLVKNFGKRKSMNTSGRLRRALSQSL